MEGIGWKLTTNLYQSYHVCQHHTYTSPARTHFVTLHVPDKAVTRPDHPIPPNCMRSFKFCRSFQEPSIITHYNAQILHPLYNRKSTSANFILLLSSPLSSSTVSTITSSFHNTFTKQCYCMQLEWYMLFRSWYMQCRLHAIEVFYKPSCFINWAVGGKILPFMAHVKPAMFPGSSPTYQIWQEVGWEPGKKTMQNPQQ